jgi:glyoxylase-like metal-dependent hydrolase (beta-lactamase superfamily II)
LFARPTPGGQQPSPPPPIFTPLSQERRHLHRRRRHHALVDLTRERRRGGRGTGTAATTACFDGINERSSKRPIDCVVNTHHHGDHTGGNATFKPAAKRTVAHARSQQNAVSRCRCDR